MSIISVNQGQGRTAIRTATVSFMDLYTGPPHILHTELGTKIVMVEIKLKSLVLPNPGALKIDDGINLNVK